MIRFPGPKESVPCSWCFGADAIAVRFFTMDCRHAGKVSMGKLVGLTLGRLMRRLLGGPRPQGAIWRW